MYGAQPWGWGHCIHMVLTQSVRADSGIAHEESARLLAQAEAGK